MLCPNCKEWEALDGDLFCSWCGLEFPNFELSLDAAHLYVGDPTLQGLTLIIKHTGSEGEIAITQLVTNQSWLELRTEQLAEMTLRPGSLITVPVVVNPMTMADDYHQALIVAESNIGSRSTTLEVVPRPEIQIVTGEYTILLDSLQDDKNSGYLEVTRGVVTVKNLSTDVPWATVELSDGAQYPCRLDGRLNGRLDFRFVIDEEYLINDIEGNRKQPPVEYHGHLILEYVEFAIERKESFRVKCYLPPTVVIPEEVGDTVRADIFLGKRKELDITLQNGEWHVGGRAELKVLEITMDQEWLRPLAPIAHPIAIPSGGYHQLGFALVGNDIGEGIHAAKITLLTNLPTPHQQRDLFVIINVRRLEEFRGTVAIDFGTTSCSCAYIDEFGRQGFIEIDPDGRPNATRAPSAILYLDSPDGHTREFEIGKRAYDLSFFAEAQPSTVVHVTRRLGTTEQIPIAFYRDPAKRVTLLPWEVASDIIGRILERAEETLRSRITRCTISHPARFSLRQINDLKVALVACGIKEEGITTIPEPVAAALSFIDRPEVMESRQEYSLMVYDFGGGTTDIALMRVTNEYDKVREFYTVRPQVLGANGNNWIGGEDVTEMVMDIARQNSYDLLRERNPYPSNIVIPLDQTKFEKAQYRGFAALNRSALKRWAEASKIALAEFGDDYRLEVLGPIDRPDLDIEGMRLALQEGLKLTVIIDGAIKEEPFKHEDVVPLLQELEDRLRPMLEELVEMMKELGSLHGIEQPDIILLAGKSSAFPLVKTVIHERFPDSTIERSADLSVAAESCYLFSNIPIAGLNIEIPPFFAGSEPNALRDPEEAADKEEQSARHELAQFEYARSRQHLEAASVLDPERADRLQDEFGFLFTSDGTEGAGARLRWCTEVWRVISNRNSFPLAEPESNETSLRPEAGVLADEELAGRAGTTSDSPNHPDGLMATNVLKGQSATSEEKGRQLEDAVARLFRTFFKLGDDVPWKIRKQQSGTQGGFDLSIEWSGTCESATEQRARCHIECKNYRDSITPRDVAEKLLSEPTRDPVIDHWILISPRSNPSNELNRFLEQQEKEKRFPFQVQVWCPETRVDELFGLEPDVYDFFFRPREGEPHPATWDQACKDRVRAEWRARLTPPLRLPRGWNEYLLTPALLCIHQEMPEKMAKDYKNYVRMRCRNPAGALLEKPLEGYVDDWLAAADKSVLFLLGEFGDGKSFFTYALARRLCEQMLADRTGAWLPLRLALSKFPGNAREFLRQRLEEFNADVGGWKELAKSSRRLVILDGFDEISVNLDPETVTQNIKVLLKCAREFEGCKLMITSRTHFFQNKSDAERLSERLGQPPVYHLAPIPKKEVLEHLERAGITQEDLLRVQSMNDPIGLASKPLFLEMLKEVLSAPDVPKDLDVVTLYERYIVQSLTRKLELLDDPNLQTRPQETIANLRNVLGEIAEALQRRTEQGYVALRTFQSSKPKQFAELLWNLSGEGRIGQDPIDEDARSRVGARSLLARVLRPDIQEEWPVDFCHRSMREYFVSVRLCQAVEEGEEAGVRFLQEVPLNNEILNFAAEQLCKRGPAVQEKLLALIRRAVPAQQPGPMGGYALTLLIRIEPHLPKDFDWTGKVFDGADMEEADFSGLDFRGSSFRNANLANVNFENSNFEHCDLTGVRIEETTHVVSVGIDPSGEQLVAAYADNLLRQWRIQLGGRIDSKVIGDVKNVEPSSAIGIHESGQRWMRVGTEWLFFDLQPDETWKLSARFAIKDALVDPRPQGCLMTLAENIADGGLQVVLLDLSKQLKLASVPTSAARYCAALGTEAAVWGDATVGVRVHSLNHRDLHNEITLECGEPSCLDVLSIATGKYLLAAGTNEGQVCVWEVDLRVPPWAQRKILELVAHDGPVTSVVFQTATKLASGSSDRSIALITWDEAGNGPATIEHRLELKLKCKGMKIAGLQTETERAKLERLIEETAV